MRCKAADTFSSRAGRCYTSNIVLDNEAARSAARRRTPAGEHDVLRRRKREALLSLLHRPHVQEMLAERVVNVLSQADFHRASLVSSRWWVERLISAVGSFIALRPPDGTVEWQHDCMRPAMDAPPTLHVLHTAARLPRDMRVGAAQCLSSMFASCGGAFYGWVPPDAKQHRWSEVRCTRVRWEIPCAHLPSDKRAGFVCAIARRRTQITLLGLTFCSSLAGDRCVCIIKSNSCCVKKSGFTGFATGHVPLTKLKGTLAARSRGARRWTARSTTPPASAGWRRRRATTPTRSEERRCRPRRR
jgi:hypothetical protein